MSIDIQRYFRQIKDASSRYEANEHVREARADALEAIGKNEKRKIAQVDSPERLVRRLRSLDKLNLVDDVLTNKRELSPGGSLNILERIIGDDNLLPSAFLPKGAFVRRSVGRVIFSNSGYGFGTGFMISRNLMMTNNHVIADENTAYQCALQFDYYEQAFGDLDAETFTLAPEYFFETDEELDFTIIALHATSTVNTDLARGWNPLIAESGKALVSERVNVIQHPDGGLQKLSLHDNEVVDVPGDFLHYVSDTRPGSSGSPVFNNQWELAALHHAGVPERNSAGEYLLTDGSVWDGSDAQKGDISWIANEGVRISSIVSHLKVFVLPTLNPEQSRLLNEVFEERPLLTDGVHSDLPHGDMDEGYGGMSSSGNAATWIIPLRVAVDLGGGLAIDTSQTNQRKHASISSNRAGDHDIHGSIETLAKERLNLFASREYYNEEDDLELYHEYYRDAPGSAYPEEWFEYFSDLVSRTHTTQLRYKRARLDYLYPWIDLHEGEAGDRVLRSIYSGDGFNPLDVITEELVNERKRLEAVRQLRQGPVALSDERLEDQLDLLEARFPFKTDHVVPQSWFGKKEPMKSDLHLLFTCGWNCNSFRSNVPYFDYSDLDERVMDDCGMRQSEGFEPKVGKGAVARATLYFLLRYPGIVGDEAREMQADRIPTLIKWHKVEPPDRYEFHRNAAIHEIQGNRNPLIDWPDLVDFCEFID